MGDRRILPTGWRRYGKSRERGRGLPFPARADERVCGRVQPLLRLPSGHPYKWLDLDALCRRLFPRDRINRIRYFTAIVSARSGDPQQPQRQQAYLRALETIPRLTIHRGRYLTHPTRMLLAHPVPGGPVTVEVIKTEEKGSDVNLATYLLFDAFRKDCDTAVVISNDSDLKEPIELVQRELGVRVGVVNPHPPGRRSRALQPAFFRQIRVKDLRVCQFAPTLRDARADSQAGELVSTAWKREDPPKRALHPAAEATGGIPR